MAATGLRTNHQLRVDWWRGQFERRKKANLSVTELCRQLDVSVTTFYYWRKRVHENSPKSPGPVAAGYSARRLTTAVSFVPVSIVEPTTTGAELEIELNNSCMLRLKGIIDPSLLQAAITAAGQLDGSREGAN
jgi:transposase-like protein